MKASAVQLRGICQCCGREQAVTNGRLAKHGYTVEQGWFEGVCSGANYAPMNKDRTRTDFIVASVRAEVVELQKLVAKLESGKAKPTTCQGHWNHQKREYDQIPFAEAPEYAQKEAVRSMIWKTTRRAEMGTSFANMMEGLADKVFGTELREVARAEAPAPIRHGETRKGTSGSILKVTRVDGARVYWISEKGTRGWTGTRAWRAFELVG